MPADWSVVSHDPAPAVPSSDWSVVSHESTGSWLDDVRDTVKQYWDKINPVTQAQGVASQVQHPLDAAKSYGQANQQLADKAEASFKSGDYAGGVRHSLSYLLNGIPGLGSALDEAGNKSGSGDYKGAVADTAALATNLLAAKVGPKVLDAAAEPGAIPATLSKVAEPVKAAARSAADLVTAPGSLKIASGSTALAGGAAAFLKGSPLEGTAAMAYGANALKEGLGVRRLDLAAKAATAADEAAAARSAEAIARNRAINPGTAVEPVQSQPIADLSPIPGQLPSGRAPMTPEQTAAKYATTPPADRTPVWSNVAAPQAPPVADATPIPGALPSGRKVPVQGQAFNPITSALDKAKQRYESRNASAYADQPVNAAAVSPAVSPVAVPEPALNAAATRTPGTVEVPEQQAQWLAKRNADTVAKDEALANWAQSKGLTGADVQPGQPYAELVKAANKELGKKYGARIDGADHPARVKALADLLDSKIATAAATDTAASLQQKGIGYSQASGMTPEQLGVTSPKAMADVLFQLKKLELAQKPGALDAAQALKDSLGAGN